MNGKTPSGKVHDYIASLAPNIAFTAKHVAALLGVSTTTVRNVAHRHFGFVASKGIFVTPPHHRQVKPENGFSKLLEQLVDENHYLTCPSKSGLHQATVKMNPDKTWDMSVQDLRGGDVVILDIYTDKTKLLEEICRFNPDSAQWWIFQYTSGDVPY